MVKRWNEALATRNAPLLKTVSGAQVRLYTKTVDRDAAVKTKAAALAAAKDYTQSIRAVEVDLRVADRWPPARSDAPGAATLTAWTTAPCDGCARWR